jgi:hypothetical protein
LVSQGSPLYKKGVVFESDEGDFYEFSRDVYVGDCLFAEDLTPLGNSPAFTPGSYIPPWLQKLLKSVKEGW